MGMEPLGLSEFDNLTRKELTTLIERQAAQIELMREFIARAPVSSGVCCCGESMNGHSDPAYCGHTPVDLWDYSVEQILSTTPDQALEQFAKRVREQCATVCEGQTEGFAATSAWDEAALSCARAIRAITEIPK